MLVDREHQGGQLNCCLIVMTFGFGSKRFKAQQLSSHNGVKHFLRFYDNKSSKLCQSAALCVLRFCKAAGRHPLYEQLELCQSIHWPNISSRWVSQHWARSHQASSAKVSSFKHLGLEPDLWSPVDRVERVHSSQGKGAPGLRGCLGSWQQQRWSGCCSHSSDQPTIRCNLKA